MKFFDYLDRVGQRRLERWKLVPPRPRDNRIIVGTLFFAGYYILVFTMLKVVIPAENAPLVRDSLLVLGPVVGGIGTALFRTDVKDEIVAANTGDAFRAVGEQAKATVAAANTSPPDRNAVTSAADKVAGAAADQADEIRGSSMEDVK